MIIHSTISNDGYNLRLRIRLTVRDIYTKAKDGRCGGNKSRSRMGMM
jgi:hypothetical protein